MAYFDLIVIGAGHAGIEAGLAAARLGCNTLMLSVNLDNIGYLACNPSVGGTGKGHLVREVDSLGGFMGIAADKCTTQIRMLNASKGLAVRSLRAQVDKYRYHRYAKSALEKQNGLTLYQGEAKGVFKTPDGYAVALTNGLEYACKAVVIAAGVYLNSTIITGGCVRNTGPAGFNNALYLSTALENLGFKLRRFKTGTPARLDKKSIDLNKLEIQYGEQVPYTFSVLTKKQNRNTEVCYLGYTNEKTHSIIKENLHLAPKYAGKAFGTGARYCPSIEDKIVRFADKQRHSFFLEPEGKGTDELYIQGISTSLPASVQQLLYSSVDGLENVRVMRDAYAIEYDCIDASVLYPSLMSKAHKGLFFAGQINGTSGYEEAAAQGIVAGINAARYIKNQPPVILKRTQSYIGVMIDDLVTVGTDEPYRMLTGRAEYRLSFRQDNADLRLMPLGIETGLISNARKRIYQKKLADIDTASRALEEKLTPTVLTPLFCEAGEAYDGTGMSVKNVLKRGAVTLELFNKHCGVFNGLDPTAAIEVYTAVRYESYLKHQEAVINEISRLEDTPLDPELDYSAFTGLRIEAREKLAQAKPLSLGQASRISGVTNADIWALIVSLRK